MAAPDAVRDPNLRNKPRLNTIEAVKQIVQRYGLRGLYTGFHLHALRDSVGSALYFGVYETVKQITAKKLGPDTSPFGGTMVAGAVCSTVPWFCVSTTCLLGHTICLQRLFRPIPSIPAKHARRAFCLERPSKSGRPRRPSPNRACTKAYLSFCSGQALTT